MSMRTFQYQIILSFLLIVLFSCRKFVDPRPPGTELNSATLFNNDATAQSAILAIYAQMESEGLAYNLITRTGYSADEMVNYNINVFANELYTNNLTADNSFTANLWTSLYKYIYQSNAIIAGMEKSTGVSEAVRKQLTGEALFIRAFCHFYLTNLFGDVPAITTTDYRVNAIEPRSSASKVYTLIQSDLSRSLTLLGESYWGISSTTTERVRPNKFAALALLARVQLYSLQFAQANQSATEVINQTALYGLEPNLNQSFLKNSKEAIWQLQAVVPGSNTYAGGQLILTSTPGIAAISEHLIGNFEAGDKRKNEWISSIVVGNATYFFPYKYKMPQNTPLISEYTMVLRLAELYLIRAEARVMQDDLHGALSDINVLRNRAGLGELTGLDKAGILAAITRERNAELFTEFGDRWLDIKRRSIATEILQPVKGVNWTPGVDELYPVPRTEILRNIKLTQNSGYN